MFKVDIKYCDDYIECDTNEDLIKSISMLAKILVKVMRILGKRSVNNVSTNLKTISIKIQMVATFRIKEKIEKIEQGKGRQMSLM